VDVIAYDLHCPGIGDDESGRTHMVSRGCARRPYLERPRAVERFAQDDHRNISPTGVRVRRHDHLAPRASKAAPYRAVADQDLERRRIAGVRCRSSVVRAGWHDAAVGDAVPRCQDDVGRDERTAAHDIPVDDERDDGRVMLPVGNARRRKDNIGAWKRAG
jgi:hypothetical protein